MSYEFQSSIYRTEDERDDAVAREWLTAGGNNNAEQITEFLRDMTDEQMASEAIEGWDLDFSREPYSTYHPSDDEVDPDMAVRRESLTAAFARARREFPAWIDA